MSTETTVVLPALQGDTLTGKTKIWSVEVRHQNGNGVIVTTHGYKDGKMQVGEKIISEGKNIGKKNETTPFQQAVSEAKTAWTKKRESSYAPVTSDVTAEEHESDEETSRGKGIDESVPLPMLAHDYNKRGKSIQFPCFVQKKFDGTRCVAVPQKGLFSRNRKSYPHLDHIKEEINKLPPNIILDGELYSDTLTFQEIVGLVKRETLKAGDQEKQLQIKYHVYDIISDQPYVQRYANLQLLFRRYKFKHLVLVQTDHCESEEKMKEMHAQYVAAGYEGIIIRNKDGLYSNARSIHLQKYKHFFDTEVKIVGFKSGEGAEEGCVIWECEYQGKTFSCRPRGTREERMNHYQNGASYIGKQLTVRYQQETDDGLLRFPVAICLRDYE
jgi:ATP-dependent DNA ligase